MRALCFILWCLCLNGTASAESGQAYLEKFMKFNQWKQNLPTTPDPAFLEFIDKTSPLSQKLRERWLYQLALDKDWATYSKHYQPSTDESLQCYEVLALYQLDQRQQAVVAGEKLWLNGNSLPGACDLLFSILLKNNDIGDDLINQRIALALEKRNIPLVTHLLKQYKPPRLDEIQQLTTIYQNPRRITELQPSELHSEFYLYGLNRLISINMKLALTFWQEDKTKKILNHAQQQAFLAHMALYKAMRNQDDAPEWFAKIEPAFYNDILLGWQIRFALKFRQWDRVEKLINQSNDKDSPCWQYWLARALEEQGQKEKASIIYQNLSKIRSYYGFLASRRLKKDFNFQNERAIENKQLLLPYQPVTDQIKSLYVSNQTLQASRLLNDFISELPKDDKSALVYWLDHDLQWHGKSVYLSNNDELNNQLSLRFPLAYRETVMSNATHYQIPPELIYAIIRQESAFRDDATSSAGAQGLMQLMPSTALVVSKSAKIPYVDKKQLLSSQKNITIGVAYLKELAKRFHKQPILMVAAYNAGPKQANNWSKNHPPIDIDIWIETLPWPETRNYLKNVIAFYAVYQYRMRKKSDISPFMKSFSSEKESP